MGSVTVPTLQMRKETQRRGDLLRPERCVRNAEFSGRAARLRKQPNGRGLRPSTPRVTRTRAGRPKISFRAAPPPPVPRTPHFALGPYDPGVPETPASLVPNPLIPASRPGPARPQPESEIVACAAVCAACSAGGGGRRERLGGRGPGGAATRHSRVELVVHPLAATVAIASRSDFRSPKSLRLGSGHFRLLRAQRNVGALAG